MEDLLINIIYLVTNLLGTYILYIFMGIFFKRDNINKLIEFISYILYFIVTSMIYIVIGIPVINVISSIVVFFGVSLNYKANLKHRLISITMIYFIMVSIETIVVLLTNYRHVSILIPNEYSSILGMISIKVITYTIALILNRNKKINNSIKMAKTYWISILCIPVCSIYMLFSIFSGINFMTLRVCMSVIALLCINFFVFYLYEKLIDFFLEDKNRQIIYEQNYMYKKQFDTVQNHLKSVSTLKHDLKNHLFSLDLLIKERRNEEAVEYINSMFEICNREKEYSKSGNIIIDSILNSKLQNIESQEVKLDINVQIPPKVSITSFDLTIILGNLLDNAFEALTKVDSEKRYLRIWIKYNKGIFIINIKNSYEDALIETKRNLLTTKEDKFVHGIGLDNVKDVVNKNNGKIEITYDNEKFNIILMMYCEISD